MIESIQNIFKIPELKKRIFFTLGLLTVYRIGGHIPTPGINGEELSKFLHQNAGALMGFFDMFSGGSLSRVTIFALGIMPYISASIILQLLTIVFPYLAALQKEGEHGRKKITQYTRYGTIGISLVQAMMIAIGLEGMAGGAFIQNPGWGFRIMTMITLTCGTAFIMWLGEQITERGIGNGISLIIFAGIVARFPAAIISTYRLFRSDELNLFTIIAMIIIMLAVIAAIVFMERGQRRIPVQYAKRLGAGPQMGQNTHIPLKLNTSGVIPPIFASSILMFPATLASFSTAAWVGTIQERAVEGRRSLHDILRRHDSLLRVLLYRGRVQPGRRRGQHEEVRRLHTWHQAGHEHLRLHIQGLEQDNVRRRDLSIARLRTARHILQGIPHKLLFRRDVIINRCWCCPRYSQPDRDPSHNPPL